jgi:hypothetical protein
LGIPSSIYKPYFAPFWIQQRVLHLLVTSSTKNRRLTYSEFQSNISALDEDEDSVPTSHDLLGRYLGGQDFKADDVVCPAYIPPHPDHMSSPEIPDCLFSIILARGMQRKPHPNIPCTSST